ncbi:MAG: PEP-CTERM sorting domain-containing protein [Phycisphaerae bacterium]|nr:PEP-CTERM sorting domain-containing protein [Phycisphaerae bacterium]
MVAGAGLGASPQTFETHLATGCGNDVIQVPEPATMALLGIGTIAYVLVRKR